MIIRLAAALILAASTQLAAAAAGFIEDMKAEAEGRVGKTYWIVYPPGVRACRSHLVSWMDYYKNCTNVTQGKLRVVKVLWAPSGSKQEHDFFEVEALPTGARGYITVQNGKTGLVDYDPQAREAAARAECVRRGEPRIGMTQEESIATCWGRPRNVVKTTTASGVVETLICGSNRALRFENGKLTAILETQ
jgi:hypothetical protein